MQTYSHFIITAYANRKVKTRQADDAAQGKTPKLPPLHSPAFLWGSILPDIPLTLITIVAIVVDLVNGAQWQPGSENDTSAVGILFGDLFFNDPWVKTAHNLFHAPLMVLGYMGLGYWLWRRGRRSGPALFWMGLACAIHTAIDIPVHYDDGPLILFPFNWDMRFYSAVSYWDSSRFGTQFAIFEHLLILLLFVWLVRDWRQRRRARAVESTSDE